MSRHHANLIRSIFHDPPSGNVHWREIESLLKHVGASLEPISGARIRVNLNRMEDVLHRPHHSNVLDASAVLHLRGFLARSLRQHRLKSPDGNDVIDVLIRLLQST